MRTRLGVLLLIAVIGFIAYTVFKSPSFDRQTPLKGLVTAVGSLTNPQSGKPLDVLGVKDFFGGIDAWFKQVTGVSLTQVLAAVWKLILWLISFLFKLVWSSVAWLLGMVGGK